MQQDAPPPDPAPELHRDPVPPADLLERDAELAALDALLAAIPDGGRLLAIEGPAGIGKTRLLAEGRERARTLDLQVLAARGAELEQQFAYGVVRQLFEPRLASASAQEHADLFAGAAELARPIFDPLQVGAKPSEDTSLAILHGLFWLTANLADQQALVVVVDDLHWCDRPSLRWLAYVLPRLEGLQLLIAVALRSGEPGAGVGLLARVTTDPRATVLRPSALSEVATGRLLAELVAHEADDVFRSALHEASGGNPLLVRELAGAVAGQRLEPTGVNASRLHELGGRAVARAVALRLSRLSADATALARAVALLGDDVDPTLAATLAGLDTEAASLATAELGRVEILSEHVQLRFVHPVVRAAVYAELSPVERSRGHTRAARLLAEAGADPERIAAQLLTASVLHDSWATTTLRAAARAAVARGAPESAVTYLRRALDEPADVDRSTLLQELGTAEARVGDPQAVDHLAAALAGTSDGPARARLALELARALFSTRGDVEEAVDVLESAIRDVAAAGDDREPAVELEIALIGIARIEPRLQHLASDRLGRLRGSRVARQNPLVLANLASDTARRGEDLTETVDLAGRALAGDVLLNEHFDPEFLYATLALISAGQLDTPHRLLNAAVEEARRRGLVGQFCLASAYRGFLALHRGSLTEAVADAELSLNASELHGLGNIKPYAITVLSDALVELGDLTRARLVLDSAELGSEVESYIQTLSFDARARLRLVEGDHARALHELLALGAFLEAFSVRNPAISPWRSEASTALLALGRREEALEYATQELVLARRWGAPRPLGTALIAAALAEGGEGGLELLREAISVLEHSGHRLQRAKGLVELGAALRRANHRSESREPLRLGLELATQCGASPLAERAETELLATGARPRRIALSGLESLTPSERRVARMAAEGRSNREIAQALFVTPKTVEVHLSSVYRKLNIRSRRELPAALSDS